MEIVAACTALGQLSGVEHFHEKRHWPAYGALSGFIPAYRAQIFNAEASGKRGLGKAATHTDSLELGGRHSERNRDWWLSARAVAAPTATSDICYGLCRSQFERAIFRCARIDRPVHANTGHRAVVSSGNCWRGFTSRDAFQENFVHFDNSLRPELSARSNRETLSEGGLCNAERDFVFGVETEESALVVGGPGNLDSSDDLGLGHVSLRSGGAVPLAGDTLIGPMVRFGQQQSHSFRRKLATISTTKHMQGEG